MRPTFAHIQEALAQLDPARSGPPGPPRPPDSAGLAAILEGDYQPPAYLEAPADRGHRLSRRTTLSLAGAATASVVAGIAGISALSFSSGAGSVEAATPPELAYSGTEETMDAASRLTAIADHTATLPDTTGHGRFDHLRYQQWSLFTRIDGEQVTSAVVPQQTELWLAGDGSGAGKLVRTFLTPQFRDGAQERAWQNAGSPGRHEPPLVLDSPARMWDGRPPTGPSALTAWLRQGHPASAGPQELLVAITDLVKEQVLTPAERAAVLRVLSKLPHLADLGTTTDRAGRPARAFAVTSSGQGLPTRFTLLVDPATGTVLGFEQTLTQSAGQLNVPIPSVVGYDLYLVADRTDTTS
jgi:hypothetical protein